MRDLEKKLNTLYRMTLDRNCEITDRTHKLINVLSKICKTEESQKELKLLKIFKDYKTKEKLLEQKIKEGEAYLINEQNSIYSFIQNKIDNK